jgi:hypothetical protein
LQRKIANTDAEKLHHARLEQLHRMVLRAAADGDQGAKNVLGVTPSDTALRIILDTQSLPDENGEVYETCDLQSFSCHYYAYEQAAASVLLQRSGQKDGVYQVVIGTEARAPRKAKSVGEAPANVALGRDVTQSKSSSSAPKSRKTVSTVAGQEEGIQTPRRRQASSSTAKKNSDCLIYRVT